jgi:putative CocE/NonD family hydrolase
MARPQAVFTTRLMRMFPCVAGWQNISPWAARREPDFQKNAEILRFFDLYLKDRSTGIETEARVHYFTMGEERWKAADTWPPPGSFVQPLFMAPEEGLGPKPADGTTGSDAYRVDPTTTSGPRSRWNSLVNLERRPVEYPDRREADRALLCYTSAPLTRAVEVTGHPLAHLFVSSDAEDGNFFVYLEDVAPDGRVIYVTEGQLRALHRKTNGANARYTSPVPYRSFERADAAALVPGQVTELLIPLLPTSYLFKPGHAIRIAVAGADRGHFAPVLQNPPTIELHRSAAHPSRIELPLPAGTELDWFSLQKETGSSK